MNAAPPPSAPPAVDLDTASLEKALGYKGNANGGVYQFSVPRAEAITERGMSVAPAMGTAMAVNFQPTGGGKAAITGDLVLLGSEVNPVLKTLRDHGIEVTALHSHLIDDSPHLFLCTSGPTMTRGNLRKGCARLSIGRTPSTIPDRRLQRMVGGDHRCSRGGRQRCPVVEKRAL